MATKNYGIRIDTDLKERSSTILKEIGIEFPDAIRLFLTQVVNRKGIPIEIKRPNSVTLAAMKELDERTDNEGIEIDTYLKELKKLKND